MPGDVPAAAADRVVALLGAQIVRHGRGQHEEARNADIVERIVAGAVRPLAVAGQAGHRLDGGLHVGFRLRHPRHVLEHRGPAAAGRVAIDLRDAILVEIDGEMIGEPGRARIAAGRMARPPGDAHRALQLLAVLPQHARELEQGGVAGGVVADADVPAVVVAVHQHELIRLAGALDLDHRHLLAVPAFLHLGADRGAAAALGERDQLLAVGIVHHDDRDARLARQVVEIGRAPDRGADAPMRIGAGIDRDHAERALLLELEHLLRKREAFGNDDLALDALRRRQRRILVLGEQRADRARIARRHVDQLAFSAVAAVAAVGRRLRLHHLVADAHLRA